MKKVYKYGIPVDILIMTYTVFINNKLINTVCYSEFYPELQE